jgi:hypothetical protein
MSDHFLFRAIYRVTDQHSLGREEICKQAENLVEKNIRNNYHDFLPSKTLEFFYFDSEKKECALSFVVKKSDLERGPVELTTSPSKTAARKTAADPLANKKNSKGRGRR